MTDATTRKPRKKKEAAEAASFETPAVAVDTAVPQPTGMVVNAPEKAAPGKSPAIEEMNKGGAQIRSYLDTLITPTPEEKALNIPLKTVLEKTQINNDAAEKIFIETGTIIARMEKALDVERRGKVDPLNQQVKEINDSYRVYTEMLFTMKELVRVKILGWRKHKEDERKKAQALLDAALAEQRAKELAEAEKVGKPPAPAFAMELSIGPGAANTTKSDTGAAVGRKVYVWKMVDEKAVPDEYWILDEKKINNLVKGGVREIPGIAITEEQGVSFRT